MQITIRFFLLLASLSISVLPKIQAVIPPPDGGYPGGNTAEGQNALQSTTSGGFNSAVGYISLFANTTGSSTQEWALERWSSTLLIPIPQLALQRCYSIIPARGT